MAFESIDRLIVSAIEQQIFPGAVLLAARDDNILYHRAFGQANIYSHQPVRLETVFDLASITKSLGTTLAVVMLVQDRQLGLEQTLAEILPEVKDTSKAQIKIKHLLYHNSGLPDHRPYYETLANFPAQERKNKLRSLLVDEPLIHPIGKCMVYSDLGFMILNWVVENISQERIDRFLKKRIYDKLGINLFYNDLLGNPVPVEYAATENCQLRHTILQGQVHDDNAYAAGGIEGHAGLFGTAGDVFSMCRELLAAYQGRSKSGIFNTHIIRQFFKRDENTGRAVGFDTPALTDSSSGRFFSKHTVGHLGFTGTSFWIDLDRSVIVVFLTNRVHPVRSNDRIKAFRPIIHDEVMATIL